jgi:hypothetical protein
MRLVLRGAVAMLLLAAASCGNPDDISRTEPLAVPPQPAGTIAGAYMPPNALQLFLRYEKDQHDLVKVAPGPCG